MRLLLFFIVFCGLMASIEAQVPDSIVPIDSSLLAAQDAIADSSASKVKKQRLKKFFKNILVDDYPNPKKALILGMVIPGAGQAYNGSFWKVPIVVGAIGTAIYNIDRNKRNRDLFVEAYRIRVDDDDDTIDQFAEVFTQNSRLKTIRDEFIRQHELSWIALFGVGVLSAAEAFVDSHLQSFDISDDLSFRPKFKLGTDQISGSYVGLGIAFQFR